MKVKIKLKNENKEYEIENEPKICEFFKEYISKSEFKILACKYNNEIKSLGHRLKHNGELEFLTITSPEGEDINRRGLIYVLAMAIHNIDENKKLWIDYKLGSGMFCTIENEEITTEFLKKVENEMKRIISQNILIEHKILDKEEAEAFYKENDTIRGKLQLKNHSDIELFYTEEYFNYFYGIMPYRTGDLSKFKLKKYNRGFVLITPTSENPNEIEEFTDLKRLHYALKEYDDIFKILKINTVFQLNQKIKENPKEVVLLAEALHEKKMAELSNKILHKGGVKMILIAGPSSSGKTTFAGKLANSLKLSGLNPITISVDNYFVEREETPKDENGNYDFETIDAIDRKLFNKHLSQLINGEEIEYPTFNFTTGHKEYLGKKLKMNEEDILIIEGIHCLNDKLTEKIDSKYKFKVYISALTVLNLDRFNRISTTDTRLIRRILRDNRTRNYSADHTLNMWYSVKRGERKNIFPFQETADFMFNSSIAYELSAYKRHILPLLEEITEDNKIYYEAQRLISFMKYFDDINEEYIPNNSLIREFIGASIFDDDYLEAINNKELNISNNLKNKKTEEKINKKDIQLNKKKTLKIKK